MDFTRYREEFSKINAQTDRLWNTVSFINVAEVVNNEIDLRALERKCWALSDSLHKINKEMNSAADRLNDEEYDYYEDEYSEVEDAYYPIDSKISAINSVIDYLQKIQDDFEENKGRDLFGDSGDIHIKENLQSIKLKRLT